MGRYLSGVTSSSASVINGDTNVYNVNQKKYPAGFLGVFGSGRWKTYLQTDFFIVPPNVFSIRVRVVGGGGSPFYFRDGADSVAICAGAGAGYAHGVFDVIPGQVYYVTVGHSSNYNLSSEMRDITYSAWAGSSPYAEMLSYVGQGTSAVRCFSTFSKLASAGTTITTLLRATKGASSDVTISTPTGPDFDFSEFIHPGVGYGGDFQATGGYGGVGWEYASSTSFYIAAGGAAGSQLGDGGNGGVGKITASSIVGCGGGGVGGGNGGPGLVTSNVNTTGWGGSPFGATSLYEAGRDAFGGYTCYRDQVASEFIMRFPFDGFIGCGAFQGYAAGSGGGGAFNISEEGLLVHNDALLCTPLLEGVGGGKGPGPQLHADTNGIVIPGQGSTLSLHSTDLADYGSGGCGQVGSNRGLVVIEY